jgi:hypothetical protein
VKRREALEFLRGMKDGELTAIAESRSGLHDILVRGDDVV